MGIRKSSRCSAEAQLYISRGSVFRTNGYTLYCIALSDRPSARENIDVGSGLEIHVRTLTSTIAAGNIHMGCKSVHGKYRTDTEDYRVLFSCA